jgi:hypothetical protein
MKLMTEDARPGVNSKESTKFVERTAKFPTRERLTEKG